MPVDAVKIFEHVEYAVDLSATFEKELNVFLTDKLGQLHPDLEISVVTRNSATCFSQTADPFMFRYAHGLKNSSSWGCQNHSHGHLSWFEFEFGGQVSDWDSLNDIADEIDNTLFIYRDNITRSTNDKIEIRYVTERGTFYAEYDQSAYNIRILDTETTIEHIAAWFVDNYRSVLESNNVSRVLISEGLAKGAAISL
jgi:hypothetical protein